MRYRAALLALAAVVGMGGCYRTHYVNFSPESPLRAPASTVPVRATGWQHFFIWGWAPGERSIDARAECGATGNVDSIRTRRTFLQGLVAAVAGYYVNVYSPWNGAVYCDERTPPP